MPIEKGTVVKKSLVTKVERQSAGDYTTKEGVPMYKFYIEMQNGDKGTYQAKDPQKPKFVQGQEAEYYLDVMTSDKNPDWKGYSLRHYSPKPTGNGGYRKKTPEEQKSIIYNVTINECLDFFIDYFDRNKTKIGVENDVVKGVYNHVVSKVFKDTGESSDSDNILYCSAIKIGIKQYKYVLATNNEKVFILEELLKTIDLIKAKLNYDSFKASTNN